MQTYIDAPWTFEVIGKLVQKYGHGQYNGVLNILMGQVKCIDSDEDNEVRNQLNEKLNEEVKNIWKIIKNYI